MKDEMAAFFDRLQQRHADAGLDLPRAPWDPDVATWMWQDDPDEDEYAPWRPIEKTTEHDLDAAAPDLAPFHPSLHAYFNSWWFAAAEGQVGGYGLTLMPVLPGLELDEFLATARGYAEAHGGRLERAPIGVEFNGLQVVVDNHSGSVAVEDWETGGLDEIAPTLADLFAQLQP